MAPKSIDSSYELKITQESVRVRVGEVSTAEDSGHRGYCENDVLHLEEEFLGGQYLKTI